MKLERVAVASTRLNYFIGRDPGRWRRNVTAYSEVAYRRLYPGIDLFLTGAGGSLQGSYVVAPAADPMRIRWRVSGARRHRIDATGALTLRLENNQTVTEEAPLAWQVVDGQQIPVEVDLHLYRDGSIGYMLPHGYDPTRPLVIAPRLIYATYFGGTNDEYVSDMAVDAEGNIYLVGKTFSKDYPVAHALRTTMTDSGLFPVDGYPQGSTILFSTYLGGGLEDTIWAAALNAGGDLYVGGNTNSTDFPVANALQPEPAGKSDAFLALVHSKVDTTEQKLYLAYLKR